MKDQAKIIALLEAIAEEVGVDLEEVYTSEPEVETKLKSHPPGPETGGS